MASKPKIPNNHSGRLLSRWALIGSMAGLLLSTTAIANAASPSGASLGPKPYAGIPTSLKAHITVWGWPGSLGGFKAAMPAFHQLYPNISVSLVTLASNSVEEKLSVALAAGSGAPDVSWAQIAWVQSLIHLGGLTNLTSYVKKYVAAHVPAYRLLNASNGHGQYYAFIGDQGPMMTYYYLPDFQKYHLSIPTTWAQYIQEGKVLKSHGIYMWQQSAPAYANTTPLTLMQAQTGVPNTYTEQDKVDIDNSKFAAAVDEYMKLWDANIGSPVNTPSGYTPAFLSQVEHGKIATIVTGAWEYSQIATWATKSSTGFGDWRAAPPPQMKAGQHLDSNSGGSYLVIPSQIKGKERKAALAFTLFMSTSTLGLTKMAEQVSPPSYLPALKSLADYRFPILGGQQLLKQVIKIMNWVPENYVQAPAANAGSTAFASAITPLLEHKENVRAFLTNATEALKQSAEHVSQ